MLDISFYKVLCITHWLSRIFFIDAFNSIHQLFFISDFQHVIYVYDDNYIPEFIYFLLKNVLVLHYFNTVLRFIVLVYSFKQKCAACKRPYMDLIKVNIYLYI